ncbi:DUF421 domain-containing protein [Liquorilactobacillus satsumensis]|uniref:Membrane protein yetF n=2 Tax=Liquorilactobacillus satsumensis TaxID=259059 RepID=A0A0R1UV52_9LACO|nr:DUF421 domain-containing protein [Liquorilactobacillus satsumensis]KRL97069.1 hypothetical protein FD50_GL001614 [Liquorilactobacillus satsumensis DSM 16230 = JCM 12392]MCC7666829.1 DUF421 domain-containing protein [Liquorilactobacillus satsumensis]MCP9312028.1 DUF421 domain-containing protein [Liquorilactobacillus satsumensis]MCP9329638.1 DUF421 domain-containing protein [Liquorilactobacillus satsumensis]MCP9358357.1 DUF421 domain-containing protein [Liquorilactobacillus satsumensis]
MDLYNPIIIKLSLGILCLILQINLLGKGNLAPTTALDQVQNYVLGGIIGGVIYNNEITTLQFVMVLLIWTLLVLITKFLKEHNRYLKNIIDGKPHVLIRDGRVNVSECLRRGISANELMFRLRAHGVYELSKVKSGILEQNGQLVVIEYGAENIRYPLIVDGQVNPDVLELLNKDTHWLEHEIHRQGYQELSDVYLGEYKAQQLHLVPYAKK